MFAYLITKTFWDVWDNWLSCLGLGLLFFGTTALAFWLGPTAGVWGLAVAWTCSLCINAAAGVIFLRVDAESPRFSLARAMGSAVFFSFLAASIVGIGCLAVWFYGSGHGLVSWSLAFLAIWILLALAMGTQLFLVLLPNFGGFFFPALRTSVVVALENPSVLFVGFLGTAFLNLTALIILPGLGGAVLFQSNLRDMLRRRYERFEKTGKPAPSWKELMAPEIETLARRDFTSLFRPWK